MAAKTPYGVTQRVTEPVGMRPMLIVGESDNGELIAWCPPDMARIASAKLREQILEAGRELLQSLERPRG